MNIGIDPLTLGISAGLTGTGVTGQLLKNISRQNYQNQNPLITEALFTGENLDQALQSINPGIDFSQAKNNTTLQNVYDPNATDMLVQDPTATEKFGDYVGNNLESLSRLDFAGVLKNNFNGLKNLLGFNDAADEIKARQLNAYNNTIGSFYNQAHNNFEHEQRANMRNVFAEGGDMGNGITMFNAGGTHEQNPYSGIQQGIASDGLPNTVEEGEVKYKDYIYSNRLKPSKTLIKDNNLPEKYFGLTYAEMAEKLQKESEDRPNDPISIQTLEDWMSRLASAQETQKIQIEERKLAKALDSMSTEDKAALMSNLMQQQEGIDLSQPMYAEGGKIHIKPSKRGTFTAAATKHGKSVQEFARQVLANKENYSPAMVKKANFARNAAHWHAIGGPDNNPYGFGAIGNGLQYLLSGQYEKDKALKNYINNAPNLYKTIPEVNIVASRTYPWGDTPPVKINIPEGDTSIEDYIVPEVENPYNTPWKTKSIPSADKGDKNTPPPADKKGLNFNAENLRYAPAVGAGIGALVAALQPVDYTLSNEYRNLASQLNPVAAPHIGGYRRYTPYDVNLGDAENLALEAAALRANRGQNRATQGALNAATINAFQKAKAQRNLAAQQANEADRLAVDTYNLGIDQFNAQRDTQYDQLNQQILNNRLNMLAQAAKAADASRTARANMINTTGTNFFNQLGNVGQDTWNYNELQKLFERLGYDKEAIAAIAGRYYGNKG